MKRVYRTFDSVEVALRYIIAHYDNISKLVDVRVVKDRVYYTVELLVWEH